MPVQRTIDDLVTCRECEELATHVVENPEGKLYCESCYNYNYTQCDACGEELANDDAQTVAHRTNHENTLTEHGPLCESCVESLYEACDDCRDMVHVDNIISIYDVHSVCPRCEDNYTSCEQCEERMHIDDAHSHDDETLCSSCYSNRCADGDDYDALDFDEHGAYDQVGSPRYFGVELETSSAPNYHRYNGALYFGAKEDGSITGKEFVSSVLSGNAGLRAVKHFCSIAKSEGFEIDSKCGFHLHVDVSDLSASQLESVCTAYKLTEQAWQAFVPESRRGNYFCGKINWSLSDIRHDNTYDFKCFATYQDRYQWFNVASYSKHRTFEIRLHTPTLDYPKVANWIKAHTRFVDWSKDIPAAQLRAMLGSATVGVKEQLAAISRAWNCQTLDTFYTARAVKFGLQVETA